MRWNALLADLEGEAHARARADLEAEVRDRVRRERALLPLRDRVAAAVGCPLVGQVKGAGRVAGVLLRTGPDWMLLGDSGDAEVLVPLEALLVVRGLSRRTATAAGGVESRLDLRWALRAVARDRAAVSLLLRDGTVLAGTLDAVGLDHVELAEHPAGEPRRRTEVVGAALVPLGALALVRAVR